MYVIVVQSLIHVQLFGTPWTAECHDYGHISTSYVEREYQERNRRMASVSRKGDSLGTCFLLYKVKIRVNHASEPFLEI